MGVVSMEACIGTGPFHICLAPTPRRRTPWPAGPSGADSTASRFLIVYSLVEWLSAW
jgi:hypothetical protein